MAEHRRIHATLREQLDMAIADRNDLQNSLQQNTTAEFSEQVSANAHVPCSCAPTLANLRSKQRVFMSCAVVAISVCLGMCGVVHDRNFAALRCASPCRGWHVPPPLSLCAACQ